MFPGPGHLPAERQKSNLLVTLDFYRGNTGLKLSVDRYLISSLILGDFQLVLLNNIELKNIRWSENSTHLATFNDDNILQRAVTAILCSMLCFTCEQTEVSGWWDGQTDLMDEFHAFEDPTKDNMFPVQPRGRDSGNELKDVLWCVERRA
jgi:hypothetical protein